MSIFYLEKTKDRLIAGYSSRLRLNGSQPLLSYYSLDFFCHIYLSHCKVVNQNTGLKKCKGKKDSNGVENGTPFIY